MKKPYAPTFTGTIGIAGGLMILFAFPIAKVEPAIPTIKVPGAYPYEETMRVPAPPTISESSVLPTPAPFLYRETSPSVSTSHDHDSRTAVVRRRLSPKAIREVAFKYNGVPYFCEFLAALPADVSVFDPKLGTTRAVVRGGHVVRKNVAWLRKRDQTHPKPTDRTLVSVEELGARIPGI